MALGVGHYGGLGAATAAMVDGCMFTLALAITIHASQSFVSQNFKIVKA